MVDVCPVWAAIDPTQGDSNERNEPCFRCEDDRRASVLERARSRWKSATAAIAPKVALKRAKQPVKVEIGNGAIAPKVAMKRVAKTSRG